MIHIKNGGDHNYTLEYTFNGKIHHYEQQYITGAELRDIFSIPEDHDIFLAIKKPWEDEHVQDNDRVDLAREGREHFYTKEREHLVTITVKVGEVTNEVKITKGIHSVSEIKQKGGVQANYDLDQLVEGKLVPLKDDGSVEIHGGEHFVGHVKDGSSS